MRLAAALSGIAYFAGMALSSDAQPCNPPNAVHAEAQNLSFSEGTLGNAPPGWFLGPEWFMPPHAPVYEAKIAQGASCNGSQQCAALHSISDSSSIRLGFLYQVVDAAQYRGKNLVFHADVRADAARGSVARLLVRVHRSDCSTSFRDDMGNHPITAESWSPYEVHAPISQDAREFEFGMQLIGQGAAWIDNISMTFSQPEKAAVRALIKNVADARNAHDGQSVAAFYGRRQMEHQGPSDGELTSVIFDDRVRPTQWLDLDKGGSVEPVPDDMLVIRCLISTESRNR
jgi:hypothetical protein